ncbi:MAG: hypothetical protein JXR61_02800 [Prolixibacteraceae bacterium]|nr:hypothetical protein [Prolixibacteraceae bacterium]
MYFLNGERVYIKPENACKLFDEQIQSCFRQLTELNPEQKLFKLNFFSEANSKNEYILLLEKLEKDVAATFPFPIVVSLLAQPPLTCRIMVEACYYDPKEWDLEFLKKVNGGGLLFRKNDTSVLIGNAQSYSYSGSKQNSEKAFAVLIDIFTDAFFPINSIVRQWNYIENILGFDGENQRYQQFNNVRSGVYGNTFSEKGYPAATGIGMNQGGVLIEFVAIKSNECITVPIDNPKQISAHTYSEKVLVGEKCSLKATPKFERARYVDIFGKKMIFISGTASIVGEHTVGVGDAGKQTEVTIQNIQKLYSGEVLKQLNNNNLNTKYSHVRVYIKSRKDFRIIKKTIKNHFGELPVVYIIADICRTDLLVEIEGKVILE